MTTAPSGKMRISVSKASSFVRSNFFSLTPFSPALLATLIMPPCKPMTKCVVMSLGDEQPFQAL
jgi:hypothetical protein